MCRSPLGTGPHHPAVGNDLSPETIGSALSGHGPSASMSPQATYPIFLSGTSAADPLLRNPNRRHGLLRPRRERPRRRAAEERDERASLHSITSSARPIRGSGMVRPSDLAVFMLIISSSLVAC